MTPRQMAQERNRRQIEVIREGRCRFCGQWTTPTSGGHTTFARLIDGAYLCQGKPKGPYRITASITRHGLNPNLWPLTPAEQKQYADVVGRLTAQVKAEKGGRAREWVAI